MQSALRENNFNFEKLLRRPPAQPQDYFESLFVDLVKRAGFLALNPPGIRCKQPVMDKDEIVKKKVTHPDCLVIYPTTKQYYFVEVTSGQGIGESKQAQQRVVKQAEIELKISIPYLIMSGELLLSLAEESKVGIQISLMKLFRWI